MTEVKTTEAVTKIVEILSPFSPEDRRRIISASMTLLGDKPSNMGAVASDGHQDLGDQNDGLPPRARAWIKQNNLSMDELQQVFHIENGKAEVIASDVPGKNKKEKTYSAYILAGLGKLLSTGNAAFDDKSARALCELSGCYDSTNHSTTIKDRGNEFTGSKESGWSLTAPGLKRAALLVKEMTSQEK